MSEKPEKNSRARKPTAFLGPRPVDLSGMSRMHTAPWATKEAEGLYTGWNRSVWLYREFPLQPLKWEDPDVQLGIQSKLQTTLVELGATSRDLGGGLRQLSRNREFHIVAVTWEEMTPRPADLTEQHNLFLDQVLPETSPVKALLIGVKLRSSAGANLAKAATSPLEQAKALAQAVTASASDTALDAYREDERLVHGILTRAGCRVPPPNVLSQLESWFNYGNGPDCAIAVDKDRLFVDEDELEIAAVMDFQVTQMPSPFTQWISAAMYHYEPASVVSIRGALEPPTVTRGRLRMAQRRMMNQIEEQAKTGDLERAEDSEVLQTAKALEDFCQSSGEAFVTDASILFARRVADRRAADTYSDSLRNNFGIITRVLDYRQLPALAEMLPCGQTRQNPFLQDLTPSVLSFSGLAGYSNVGDGKGVWLGHVDPDDTPFWLDPAGAPAANLPPAMAVCGDPGSGKTFLCQFIALQAALAGHNVFMINPKGFDSLRPFAEFTGSLGVPHQVVSMQNLENGESGAFDPFHYCDPEMAAEVLAGHIISVLGRGNGLTSDQEVPLMSGLKLGAQSGARCAYEALEYVDDPLIRQRVIQQAEGDSMFALALAKTPKERTASRGLTLIEFDRDLDLPESNTPASEYTRGQRIALAAIRLVVRASMEMLMRTRGGILIVDEAWTFLSSSEGLLALQRLGRLGRSLNLLPIFATQRIHDILKNDLEGYLSRVFAMKLSDEKEATAALKLVGLAPTAERLALLKEAQARPGSDGVPARGALALHRDLHNRKSLVEIGPVPDAVRMAFSTNTVDKAKREAQQQQQQAEAGKPAAGTFNPFDNQG